MFIENLPSKNVSCLVLSAIHKAQCTFFCRSLHVYCEERDQLYSFFLFLAVWLGMRDLSSLNRNRTYISFSGSTES